MSKDLSDVGMAKLIGAAIDAEPFASLSHAEASDLRGMLCDVAQLLDGWHVDVAWTEWDEGVRAKVSKWARRVERIFNA